MNPPRGQPFGTDLARSRNEADQRGRKHHVDGATAGRRHDGAHRLRQHHPEERPRLPHAERPRGLGLAALHLQDARDVSFINHDGLSLWVAVEDEKYALITLAAHGMTVTPGSRFYYQDGPDLGAPAYTVRAD